jgi:hypothetical protein
MSKNFLAFRPFATLSPVRGWELITIVILETKVPPHRPRPRAERKDKMYGFCLDNQIDYDRHLFKLK